MPVFLRWIRISFNVSDNLAVRLGRSIKAEWAFNIFILQIAVNGFRAPNHLNTGIMRRKVFRQNRCIGIGIISADDDNGRNSVLFADIRNNCKLFIGFQFCSSGTDDIKTAGIAELIDVSIIENQIIIFNQTDRTVFKAIKNVFRIRCL